MVPFSFGEDEVNLDEAVSVTCTITKGDIPVKIWWSFYDAELRFDRNLSSNDGVMVLRNSQKISSLNIDAVKSRHRGKYTCSAENRAGIAQLSAFLAVNGDLLETNLLIQCSELCKISNRETVFYNNT